MKFQLGICELYHLSIHGKDANSNDNIDTHFIIRDTITIHEYYNNSYTSLLNYLFILYISMNQRSVQNIAIRNLIILLVKRIILN